MRINQKILSIPPYISTSWKNVASLHVEQVRSHPVLVIILHSGSRIEIPELEVPLIDAIFHAHSKFLEQEQLPAPMRGGSMFSGILPSGEQISFSFPIKLGEGGGLDSMGTLLQHNPEQKDAPPLPPDMLSKIALLAKSVGAEEANNLPQAEPHCNCMHCQIVRAMHTGADKDGLSQTSEEQVTEEDLRFRTWDIEKKGDKLYVVTNPLNDKEKYNVYLGHPVGCTCGENGCEHIQAVLKS